MPESDPLFTFTISTRVRASAFARMLAVHLLGIGMVTIMILLPGLGILFRLKGPFEDNEYRRLLFVVVVLSVSLWLVLVAVSAMSIMMAWTTFRQLNKEIRVTREVLQVGSVKLDGSLLTEVIETRRGLTVQYSDAAGGRCILRVPRGYMPTFERQQLAIALRDLIRGRSDKTSPAEE